MADLDAGFRGGRSRVALTASTRTRPTRRACRATGAWREGDPAGRAGSSPTLGDAVAAGGRRRRCPDVARRLRDLGRRSPPDGDNAVLVLHALTGDSHVVGPGRAGAPHRRAGGTRWSGPGAPLDTDRWFVVAPNVLGGCQGTHRPGVAGARRAAVGLAGSRCLTVRDQVAAEAALADALGHRPLGAA